MILFSALLLFLGLAHAGDDDQVVELLSTSQTWDPYRPWVKNDPSTVTWQGVYLGDNTVVTTARAVANTTLIRAIAHGSPDRYPARVVHVEPDLDLALAISATRVTSGWEEQLGTSSLHLSQLLAALGARHVLFDGLEDDGPLRLVAFLLMALDQ